MLFRVQLTELQIIDVAENICNMKKEESDWILKLDIVEKGDKLQVGPSQNSPVSNYLPCYLKGPLY